MKILILRFSSIGDIVLTTPVIRCLKKQIPSCEIHYCTKKSMTQLLTNNPYIDKIIAYENSIFSLVAQLKMEQYDLIIDLHHNLRTLVIKSLLLKKSYSFDKQNIQKWLIVNLKINKLTKLHIVDRYLKTLTQLKVINDGQGLDYFFEPNNNYLDKIKLPFNNGNYFCLIIGGQKNTKKLPFNKLQELILSINNPIILIGGTEEAEIGYKLQKMYSYVFSTCGKLSIDESAWVIKNSKAVIAQDTGMMHIAAALKKPIISIWGNTIPAFGMKPYFGLVDNKNIVLEINELKCRPCSKIGFEKCPKNNFNCMQLQNFENVPQLLTKISE
jgi:ADP-heptose:LPS heptosyltransferase